MIAKIILNLIIIIITFNIIASQISIQINNYNGLLIMNDGLANWKIISKMMNVILVLLIGGALVTEICKPSNPNLSNKKPKEETEKEHKQTYKEYVDERLEIERMMK